MNTPPAALMFVFVVPVAATPAPAYQPTDESINAARREMGRMGLAPLMSSRPKLSAADRKNAEAKANARKWGHG
jgi:hypothetical protein